MYFRINNVGRRRLILRKITGTHPHNHTGTLTPQIITNIEKQECNNRLEIDICKNKTRVNILDVQIIM